MERLNIPRCAYRGPCGAASEGDSTPARRGSTDRTTEAKTVKTKEIED